MKVTKKLKSDLEIIDSLQRITGYKLIKNNQEKSPRMILLQKITNNEGNIPIKVQLLKTKNNIKTTSNLNNMNATSLSTNKHKISYNKLNNENITRGSLGRLKDSLVSQNRRSIQDSPKSNVHYKNSTFNIINQSPIKKMANINLNSKNNSNINNKIDDNSKEPKISGNKILNILSKNFDYNKKKSDNKILSPPIFEGGGPNTKSSFHPSRILPSDTKNYNKNEEYGTNTYIGKDNYSVNSFKNMNLNSPKTPSYVTDIDSLNQKTGKNNSNNNYMIDIKLEDLILLEERFNDIIIAINHGNSNINLNNNVDNSSNKYDIGASNECYEFFVFYFHSSLKYKFPFFFHDENKVIIQSAINLKLFIIMITYHLSLNPNLILKLLDILKLIYSILRQNLYLFIKKLMIFYGEAFVLQNEMYFKNFNFILSRNALNNLNENEIKEIIYQNCTNVVKNISEILNYYKTMDNPYYLDFYEIFCILSRITEKEINNYFCTYLFNSKTPKNVFSQKINNITIPHNNTINSDVELLEYKKNRFHPPYIPTPTNKKYTLVLDLDKTLIYYNEKNPNNIYTLRPGLFSFLNILKPIYELISFTNESKEYSDKLLKEIESNKKYFDFNLYREHNILIGRNLVKDISKIGRDMKRIVIVDKLYENIKATPKNGILIKPYFGERDKGDTVLFELKKLLILFHKMGYEDIRIAIKNYENDIKYKITRDNNIK
jgi:hypothetical protein